jgi:hypothetical protein
MATTYDSSTFDISVLPGGLHRDAQSLIQGAVALGWKVQVKRIMATLISPNGDHTITLSASNHNIPYERHRRTIHKFANPLLLPKDDKAAEALARDSIKAQTAAHQTREQREAEDHRVLEQRRAARKATPIKDAFDRAAQKVSDQKLPPLVLDKPALEGERYVVSEFPMLAHAGQKKGYISPTTNERAWSDGSVDYTCRSEGCDFATDDRSGVGRHWRTHVRAGEEQSVEQPRETYTVPPHEPIYQMGYTPRRERITALSRVLESLDLTAMTAEELAEFVLNWQHQQSESGSRMAAEREEMTSDDVLNRIRSLLDNGTYLAQQERITQLEQDVQSLVTDVTVAQTEAQRAKETLATFRELVAEVDA